MKRLWMIVAAMLAAWPGSAHAALPKYFAGAQTGQPSASVSADIETPVWGPSVQPTGYVYDWVMEQNPNGTNPFLAQVGWMADDHGGLYVAAYAWVGGPGGWSDYRTFPSISLVRGQTVNYAVVSVGGNWWSLRVNGAEVVRYNLPSGPTAYAQEYLESQGDNQIPDVAVRNVTGLAGCVNQAQAPYVLLYPSCSGWYVRWIGP